MLLYAGVLLIDILKLCVILGWSIRLINISVDISGFYNEFSPIVSDRISVGSEGQICRIDMEGG